MEQVPPHAAMSFSCLCSRCTSYNTSHVFLCLQLHLLSIILLVCGLVAPSHPGHCLRPRPPPKLMDWQLQFLCHQQDSEHPFTTEMGSLWGGSRTGMMASHIFNTVCCTAYACFMTVIWIRSLRDKHLYLSLQYICAVCTVLHEFSLCPVLCSNLIRPSGMSMPSSNPSSPSKGVSSIDHFGFSDANVAMHKAAPTLASSAWLSYQPHLVRQHCAYPCIHKLQPNHVADHHVGGDVAFDFLREGRSETHLL